MRDKNQDIQLYICSLDKELSKLPKRILELRTHVVDSPNFQFDHLANLPRKRDEILILTILLRWLPKELQSFFEVELEERIKKFSFQDRKELKFFLNLNKEEILYSLSSYTRLSDRDFFGNLLPKGRKILSNIRFSRSKMRKPRYVQRKRGYDDQGSKRPDSLWLANFDISFTEEQNFVEVEREFLEVYIKHTREMIQQDINLLKIENSKEFPVSCRVLGKPYFLELLFENWEDDSLPINDYLRSLSKMK